MKNVINFPYSLPTKMRYKISTLLLVAVLASHNCAAQENEKVNVQFISFPTVFKPEPIEIFLGEGKTFTADAPANALSKIYQIPRMEKWAIGEMTTNEEGEKQFVPFGQAPAIAAKDQIVLLIRKGATNAEGLEIIPVNSQTTQFGGGKFMFVNTCKIGIAGDCGGAKFVVETGQSKIVRPKTDKDNKRNFQATFYFRKDDEARPFWSSKWPVSEKTRGIIFFYHDPDTRQIRLHTIRDFLP